MPLRLQQPPPVRVVLYDSSDSNNLSEDKNNSRFIDEDEEFVKPPLLYQYFQTNSFPLKMMELHKLTVWSGVE